MKLHALVIAAALAAGSAFAAGTTDSATTPAGNSATAAATDQAPAKVHRKKMAKKAHAQKHASARHHQMHASAGHHQMHARAHMRGHDTHAMGAGPSRDLTNLDSRSRQRRMDQAYADWQAHGR
jgi:hypothetical protein